MALPEAVTVYLRSEMSGSIKASVVLLLMLVAAMRGQAPATSTIAPLSEAQQASRYALRSGDTITLEYRLTPEFNQTAMIQPDGFVSLPLVGSIHVAGLTLDQVRAQVVGRATSRLKDPEVNVTLKEFERPFIVVAGEVPKPGKLDFYERTTALQAILLAGGFSSSGQQSDVYVFRKIDGGLAEVHHLNLKGMNHTRNLQRDLVLEAGDMILVPRNKLDNVGRFMKATNLSVYFDPLTYTPH